MPILNTKFSAWGAFSFSPGVFRSGKVLDDLSGAMLQFVFTSLYMWDVGWNTLVVTNTIPNTAPVLDQGTVLISGTSLSMHKEVTVGQAGLDFSEWGMH